MSISLGMVLVPSPKLVINTSRTSENLHFNKQTERYIVRDPFTLILELVKMPLEDSKIFFFFFFGGGEGALFYLKLGDSLLPNI